MSHDGRASFTTHAEDDKQERDDQGNFPSPALSVSRQKAVGEKGAADPVASLFFPLIV